MDILPNIVRTKRTFAGEDHFLDGSDPHTPFDDSNFLVDIADENALIEKTGRLSNQFL
jgi:hypothetical protein